MKYIDSGIREAEQTVAFWMEATARSGIRGFRCQVGYFTLEGSSLLVPALKKCASDGAVVRLLLGSNGGATLASHVAFLAGAFGVPRGNVSLGVVSFGNSLFHPKVYHFEREDGSQTAYVGSANLTEAAISGRNVEAGLILDSSDGDDLGTLNRIADQIEWWFTASRAGLSQISGHNDIDELLASGFLALAPVRRTLDIEEEEGSASARAPSARRAALTALYRLPAIEDDLLSEATAQEAAEVELESYGARTVPERRRFVRSTEASFHYPQGTHLGHILTILWHFSQDRAKTAFDDRFIRLDGSLGAGRLAAYRRQVKYKLQAAIELGLLTDIRLVPDTNDYVPELTDLGRQLWDLLSLFVDTDDLVLEADESGSYSSRMPQQPAYYNNVLRNAQASTTLRSSSAELSDLYKSVVLNMPAVKQMLKLLYHTERSAVVGKSDIYGAFFTTDAVRNFCNEMGIEPATDEGARHRCPFLLNLLDSCGIIDQSAATVYVKSLALAPDMLVSEGGDVASGVRLLPQILDEWGRESTLAAADLSALRALFGRTFLTRNYHLQNVLPIPVSHA